VKLEVNLNSIEEFKKIYSPKRNEGTQTMLHLGQRYRQLKDILNRLGGQNPSAQAMIP